MNIETLVNISKLFIPVIAFVGIYIAQQQFAANREKVHLDLYDKRFKVYDTIIRKLENLAWGWNEDNDFDFDTACNEATFLLPDSVCAHVELAKKYVRDWYKTKSQIEYLEKRGTGSDKANEYIEKLSAIELSLEKLVPVLTASFKTALKFERF